MTSFETLLLFAGLVYVIAEGLEVLFLKPKRLIRKTPVAVRTASLIVGFVNFIVLLSYVLSNTVVPVIVANQNIFAALTLLGIMLLVSFGASSVITSKAIFNKLDQFIHMTDSGLG